MTLESLDADNAMTPCGSDGCSVTVVASDGTHEATADVTIAVTDIEDSVSTLYVSKANPVPGTAMGYPMSALSNTKATYSDAVPERPADLPATYGDAPMNFVATEWANWGTVLRIAVTSESPDPNCGNGNQCVIVDVNSDSADDSLKLAAYRSADDENEFVAALMLVELSSAATTGDAAVYKHTDGGVAALLVDEEDEVEIAFGNLRDSVEVENDTPEINNFLPEHESVTDDADVDYTFTITDSHSGLPEPEDLPDMDGDENYTPVVALISKSEGGVGQCSVAASQPTDTDVVMNFAAHIHEDDTLYCPGSEQEGEYIASEGGFGFAPIRDDRDFDEIDDGYDVETTIVLTENDTYYVTFIACDNAGNCAFYDPDGNDEDVALAKITIDTTPCINALSGDGSVSGAWTGVCESASKSYARYYTFTLSESSEVTITLESDADTVLYLLSGAGEDGEALHDNDDHADESDCAADLVRSTDSCIVESLDAGDYTIEATTYDPGKTGDFTLTVSGIGSAPASAETDRAALVALYNATGGGDWTNNTNWLSDELLDEWYGVTTDSDGRVIELNLTENGLSGEIPSVLGGLTNLQIHALGGNDLTGEIPTELGSLANLTELYLWGNELTGEIPAELGNLANLRWLSLVGNRLSGQIPAKLGNLTRLENLRLWSNDLTGEIPSELGDLSNLTELDLDGNDLTGEIPTELGNLSNLVELSLTRNQLTGEIPSELGNLPSLEVLALGGNDLTGEIPTELGSLANLTELYLWSNELTGEIPADLGNLANLRLLSLVGNQLSGQIPAKLGNLTRLENLRLWSNDLTGEIPSELGDLSNLTELDLDGNQLNGEIPSELGNLSQPGRAEPHSQPADGGDTV